MEGIVEAVQDHKIKNSDESDDSVKLIANDNEDFDWGVTE